MVLRQADTSAGAKQAAEKLATEGGGGFIPRIKPIKSTSALAAEGCFQGFCPKQNLFPQPVKPSTSQAINVRAKVRTLQ